MICHIGVSLVVFASRSCMCALPRNEICSQYIKSLSACLHGISMSFALLELIVSGGIYSEKLAIFIRCVWGFSLAVHSYSAIVVDNKVHLSWFQYGGKWCIGTRSLYLLGVQFNLQVVLYIMYV